MTSDLSLLRQRSTGRSVVQATSPVARLQTPSAIQVPFINYGGEAILWDQFAKTTANVKNDLESYVKEQEARQLLTIDASVDEQAVRLRNQYAYKPKEFERAWDKYSADVLKDTEGRFQPETRIMLDKKFAQNLGTIMSERRAQDRQLSGQAMNEKFSSLQNEMLSLSYKGQTGSEEFQSLYAQAAALEDTAVNLGFSSPELKEVRLDQLSDLARVETILGSAASEYGDKGFDSAETYLMDALSDPSLNLSPTEKQGAVRRGIGIVSAMEAQDKKAKAEADAEQTAKLSLQISRVGTPFEDMPEESFYGVNGIYKEIEEAEYLTPAQKAGYAQQLDNQMQKKVAEIEYEAKVVSILSGGLYDRNDNDTVKAINFYYDKNMIPAAQDDPQKLLDDTVSFVEKTQIVPEKAQTMVRGMLFTGDVEQQAFAADFIRNVTEVAPQSANDFGTQAIQKADFIADKIGNGGNAEEAVRLYEESTKVTPQLQEYRQKITGPKSKANPAGQNHLKMNRGFLEDISNRGIGSFITGQGFRDIGVPDAMHADFSALQNDLFIQTGDLESSQKSAWRMLNRVWGESTVGTGGQRKWAKFAPEKFVNSNSEKLQEQLSENVKSVMPDVDDKNIRLIPDQLTDRQYSAGEVPTYQVMVIKDGIFEPVFDKENPNQILRFKPEADLISEEQRAERERQGQNAIAAAKDAGGVQRRVGGQLYADPLSTLTNKTLIAPIASNLTNALSFYGREFFGDKGDE